MVDSDCVKLFDDIKSLWPEFHITISDIITPDSQFVMEFYSRFLKTVKIDIDAHIRMKLQTFSNPEALYDIIYPAVIHDCIKCYLLLHNLASIISLPDILQPTAKRTRSMLKIVLNNLFYCINFLNENHDMRKEMNTKLIQIGHSQQQCDSMKAQSNNFAMQLAKLADNISTNKKLRISTVQPVQDIMLEQEQLDRDAAYLVVAIENLQKEEIKLSTDLQNLLTVQAGLENQIVDVNLIPEYEFLKTEVHEFELKEKNYDELLGIKVNDESHYMYITEKVNIVVKDYDLIFKRYDQLEEQKSTFKKEIEHNDDNDTLISKLDIEIMKFNIEMQQEDAEYQALNVKWQNDKLGIDMEINAAEGEVKITLDKIHKQKKQNEVLTKQIKEMKELLEEYEKKSKGMDIFYRELYARILEGKKVYDSNLYNYLKVLKKNCQ